MGAGVALTVKLVYPSAYEAYRMCLDKKRELGKSPMGSTTICPIEDTNLVIVNAITQEFYGNDGRRYTDYDAVRASLVELRTEVDKWHKIFKDVPRVLNFPLIGCGLGGADWEVVASIIEEEIDDSWQKVLWTKE